MGPPLPFLSWRLTTRQAQGPGRAQWSRPTKGLPPCGGGAPVRTLGRKGETPRLLERLNLRMPPSVSLRSTAPPQGGEPRPGAPCAPLQKGDAPLIRPLIRPFGPPSPLWGEGLRCVQEAAPSSSQALYPSLPPSGESSFISLLLLSPPNPRLPPLGFGGDPTYLAVSTRRGGPACPPTRSGRTHRCAPTCRRGPSYMAPPQGEALRAHSVRPYMAVGRSPPHPALRATFPPGGRYGGRPHGAAPTAAHRFVFCHCDEGRRLDAAIRLSVQRETDPHGPSGASE